MYAVPRRHEFQCLGPVLLVVPDDMLALWEGEFAFWAGAPINIRAASCVGSMMLYGASKLAAVCDTQWCCEVMSPMSHRDVWS